MNENEVLREFLEMIKKSGNPALLVTKKQSAGALAESVQSHFPEAVVLDSEALSSDELEAFLLKRLQQEGTLIVPLTVKTPMLVAGYLNTLFEQKQFKAHFPAGWQTFTPHPKFRIIVTAEKPGLDHHKNLIKKTHFLFRWYEKE